MFKYTLDELLKEARAAKHLIETKRKPSKHSNKDKLKAIGYRDRLLRKRKLQREARKITRLARKGML